MRTEVLDSTFRRATRFIRPRWAIRPLPVIFAITAITGLIWLASPFFHVASAYSEEERIGIHLANGDGFLSPFAEGATAPLTSWCPPIYPLLVAAADRALGVRSSAAILSILIFNILCRAAAAAAIAWLGRRLFGVGAGLIAAALFIIDPIFLHVTALCWDNSLALAMFLWLLAASLSIRDHHPTPSKMASLGVGLGLLLLTNAAYGLASLFLLVIPVTSLNARRSRAIMAGLFAIALTLTPWTARNYAVFHQVFFIRGNASTELWLGNLPGTTGWLSKAAMQLHPSENPHSRAEIIQSGETAYFQICRQRFIKEIRQDLAGFVRRCCNRLAYLFLLEPRRQGVWFTATLATLGVAGAWAAWRIRRQWFPLAAAGFCAVIPSLFTQVHERYTLPLRAILILFAAFALHSALRIVVDPKNGDVASY